MKDYDKEKFSQWETIIAMAAALTAAGYGKVKFVEKCRKKGKENDT